MQIYEIIKKIKNETNNLDDIIYRKKIINKKEIYIIYNEPLTSSNKISDFVIRSLTNISINSSKEIVNDIKNNISNFKINEIYKYNDIVSYLHKGFTIILIQNSRIAFALETKANLSRSISSSDTERTIRGPKDSFIEEYQINIGLIKKRIKTNDLWIDSVNIGKYTNTKVGILYINGIVKPELVDNVKERLNSIDISGIFNSGMVKNLIQKESISLFPTIKTTERPDVAAKSLLEGKVVIVLDNSPYALIIPGLFKDFFVTEEDYYGKSINVSFTRILRYISFFIALLVPALYISFITYNQEMIPTELLISFAIQRNGVPFPAFFEAFIMMISFEILRESDLRVPSFSGSALSIVGALILGEAAVNAGIVSPIMIIVIAITAISSLPFNEPEMINGLRWWRIIFMIGASFLGIIGVVAAFLFFLIKIASLETFDIPYLYTYTPYSESAIKDSIFRAPLKKIKKREKVLSNNIVMQGSDKHEI